MSRPPEDATAPWAVSNSGRGPSRPAANQRPELWRSSSPSFNWSRVTLKKGLVKKINVNEELAKTEWRTEFKLAGGRRGSCLNIYYQWWVQWKDLPGEVLGAAGSRQQTRWMVSAPCQTRCALRVTSLQESTIQPLSSCWGSSGFTIANCAPRGSYRCAWWKV